MNGPSFPQVAPVSKQFHHTGGKQLAIAGTWPVDIDLKTFHALTL
jgi:hypothetical protein